MAMRSDIENHLKTLGAAGTTYTVSGSDATVSGNLTHNQIEALLSTARQAHHEVKLVAGALKVVSG